MLKASFKEGNVVFYEDNLFFGNSFNSVMNGDLANLSNILESNGFSVSGDSFFHQDINAEIFYINGQRTETIISAEQEINSSTLSLLNMSGIEDLGIGIGDIRGGDSMVSVLSKLGFANAEQLTEYISSHYETIYNQKIDGIDRLIHDLDNYDLIRIGIHNKEVYYDIESTLTFSTKNPKRHFTFYFDDGVLNQFVAGEYR